MNFDFPAPVQELRHASALHRHRSDPPGKHEDEEEVGLRSCWPSSAAGCARPASGRRSCRRARRPRPGHGRPVRRLRGGRLQPARPAGAALRRPRRGQHAPAAPRPPRRPSRRATSHRWLRGEVRSCFAMTEPAPGAGSDPTMLRTTAAPARRRLGDQRPQVVHLRGDGRGLRHRRRRHRPDRSTAQGATLFLVDAGTPGFEVVRAIPTHEQRRTGRALRGPLRPTARVPDEQVLGELGEGFKLMQVRLGPARLTHCMRWLGAARAGAGHRRAPTSASGRRSARRSREHQAVQWLLADSLIDLHASRLMVLHAAWKLDQGDEARQETSMCKVFVAEAVGRVIDRCVQVCGALGISRDLLLERLYRDVRRLPHLRRAVGGASHGHRPATCSRDRVESALSVSRPPAYSSVLTTRGFQMTPTTTAHR